MPTTVDFASELHLVDDYIQSILDNPEIDHIHSIQEERGEQFDASVNKLKEKIEEACQDHEKSVDKPVKVSDKVLDELNIPDVPNQSSDEQPDEVLIAAKRCLDELEEVQQWLYTFDELQSNASNKEVEAMVNDFKSEYDSFKQNIDLFVRQMNNI